MDIIKSIFSMELFAVIISICSIFFSIILAIVIFISGPSIEIYKEIILSSKITKEIPDIYYNNFYHKNNITRDNIIELDSILKEYKKSIGFYILYNNKLYDDIECKIENINYHLLLMRSNIKKQEKINDELNSLDKYFKDLYNVIKKGRMKTII